MNVTAQELRVHATYELGELGPEPLDPRQRLRWQHNRAAAVTLLARLAQWEDSLLRRATLETASKSNDHSVRELLLDAAQECG